MRNRSIMSVVLSVGVTAGCSGGGGSLLAGTAHTVASQSSNNQTGQNAGDQIHYSVVELPSLGGTFSLASAISEDGTVDGLSNLPGDATTHAVIWRKTGVTDLGTLGGPNSSANIINDEGFAAGFAESATTDPLGEDFCQDGTHAVCSAVVWNHGRTIQLPTLGGNNAAVLFGFNDHGQVVGAAETAMRDGTCPAPQALQLEAVIWEPTLGTVQRLPPFAGDTNGEAFSINQRGEVVGSTGTCANVFPNGVAATHAVLWRNGHVIDLGSLGGATNNGAYSINNRSQVVGFSDLPGDTTKHGFLWQNGAMTDLGTLPGDTSSRAIWINEPGQIVGFSCAQGNCRATLWQHGTAIDLNDRIPADSPLFLLQALGINSRGSIIGYALNNRTNAIVAFVATPNDEARTQTRSPSGRRVSMPESARHHLGRLPAFTRRGLD